MSLGKKGFLFFVFLWGTMSFGKKVLTSFLIFLFVIGLLAIIKPGINDNNREVSQQQVPQTQRVEQQAVQTQARIEAQEAQSRELLLRCQISCRRSPPIARFDIDYESAAHDDENRCRSRCEQDALTRNIEINKLREMQK